jgi:hypothetical protein
MDAVEKHNELRHYIFDTMKKKRKRQVTTLLPGCQPSKSKTPAPANQGR